MLNKSFLEMMKVDVTPYVKERDKVQYLPWSACLYLLHKEGAEKVEFYPIPGPDGHTLRHADREFTNKSGKKNAAYEVMVHIVVDNNDWTATYPVSSGITAIADDMMNQIRVHAAVRRCFVKSIAEHTGLGFSLWMNEDDLPDEGMDLSKHSLRACKERLQELVTYKINSGIPLNVIADRLGMDEDTLRSKFSLFNELARLEKAIGDMQP